MAWLGACARCGSALIPAVPGSIAALPESTPGSGTHNESLATAQARLSGRSGVTFAFLGEDGAGGPVGAEQGRVGLILEIPQREQNGVLIPAPVPIPAPYPTGGNPPKCFIGTFPFSFTPQPHPRELPVAVGCPKPSSCREVQERDVFVPSATELILKGQD